MRHKYGARKTELHGIKFDSKKEATYYQELLWRQKYGEVVHIELQPVYELQPSFMRGKKKIRPITYVADFKVTYKDGTEEIIDVKSPATMTPVYKIKKKMFEYRYPHLSIKEV